MIFTHSELKYVIVRLADGNDMILTGHCRFGSDHVYHSDIVGAAKRGGLDIVQVLGGGRVSFDQATKKIDLFAQSGSYGRAPHRITERLVQQAMADEGCIDFALTVTGTFDDSDRTQ